MRIGLQIISWLALAGTIVPSILFLADSMGLDQVKFRKPVVPGDQLIMELEVLKQRAKIMKLSGVAKVDDQIVAQAQLMATLEV